MTPYQHVEALREALGGRRFLLTVGAGIVNTLLLAHGLLPAAVYETLTMMTVGFYIAGNGAQRFFERKFGGQNAEQSPNS